ncbi:MAG: hypothetical protein FRX49_04222 [Trebouxia sp. A1-2]|nr:MAG: hypothetical protein FRX49_04222 [Trebouxia sp. A1-2]
MTKQPKGEVLIGLPCGVENGKQAKLIAGNKLTFSRPVATALPFRRFLACRAAQAWPKQAAPAAPAAGSTARMGLSSAAASVTAARAGGIESGPLTQCIKSQISHIVKEYANTCTTFALRVVCSAEKQQRKAGHTRASAVAASKARMSCSAGSSTSAPPAPRALIISRASSSCRPALRTAALSSVQRRRAMRNEGLPAARHEPVLLLDRRSPEAACAGHPSADEALWIWGGTRLVQLNAPSQLDRQHTARHSCNRTQLTSGVPSFIGVAPGSSDPAGEMKGGVMIAGSRSECLNDMTRAEPGLSQSMAEASSDGLAGLPAILSGAPAPDA